MKFSPSKQSFYPDDMLADYAAAGTLPDDLRDIDDAQHAALIAQQSQGTYIDWTGAAPVSVALPAPDPKVAVQAEIDQLERDSMTNRGARELQLELMREKGAANGLQSDEAIAAKVPYFKKLLALDTQIRALRAQL